jgi:hypothetical protein
MTTPTAEWALADLDPVAAVVFWLREGYQPLVDRLAASATGEGPQVGAVDVPPYPRLRIDDVNVSLRDVRHLVAVDLRIEVLGELVTGAPGKPELSRLAVATVEALTALCEQPAVRGVTFTGILNPTTGHSALATGQERYLVNCTLYCHGS